MLSIVLILAQTIAAVSSGPLVISGKSGEVVQGLHITNPTGDCVQITNSTDITLENDEIGPCGGEGVKITGGNGISIYDSYIHVQTLNTKGCCDRNDGVLSTDSSNLDIQGNVIAYNESNIEVHGGSGITVVGNFLLNPRGPFPRGQNFQCWKSSSGLCMNVTVADNYALSSTDTSKYLFPENQEDSINFGQTSVISAHDNFITGGHSASGCGLIADINAQHAQFVSNRLLDTGQCGIGITDGVDDLVQGNKVLNRTPVAGGGNTAIYVWQPPAHSKYPCGPVAVDNNIATEYKPNGSQSGYWKGAGCNPTTLSGNTFGAAADPDLTPVSTVFPTPLVPPEPKACVVKSPYSTQTSLPACQ